MVSSSPAFRIVFSVLTLSALATVLAVLSCWNVGWLSEDWVMLERTRSERAFFEELRHISLPRRALWWAAAHGAGPWLFRLVGVGCHLVASLVVLPRVAALLFPASAHWTGYLAGLVLLALPVTIDPLVWASTVAYPILELVLLLVAYAHLRWLRDGDQAWRAGSWLATAAALLTWELGVAAPLVVTVLSVLLARQARRLLGDVAPHVFLVALWFALKLWLGSTEALDWRGPSWVLGHVLTVPLLVLSPWPLGRHLLTAWPGVLLAVTVFALVLAAAWRLGRVGIALLLLTWGVLGPVLAGGPEARYLLVAAPWLVLLATAGLREVTASSRGAGRVALLIGLIAYSALAAGASWWQAVRWRTADVLARSIVDGVTRAARAEGRVDVVVIDAPDRVAGWGPTSKAWVWRNGLRESLALRGLRLVGLAHTVPADPEVIGLRPATPPWSPEDLRSWRAQGLLVLACRPNGRGGYDVVPLPG